MREGWTYKKFEDCLVKAAKAKQVQTSEYNSGSKYPIISQEDKMVSGYCDDSSLLYHIDNPVVIFGDHTRVLKYVDFDFVVGADGVKILIPKDFLKAKYLLYYLRWYKVPSLGYSRHYKLLKEINIPIPPLSEQERIVSELDLLSSIIEKKKEQLKAYDQLAQSIFYDMFGDPIENLKGWEMKKLEECVSSDCSISYGIVQPGDDVQDGVPVVRPIDLTNTFVYRKGLKVIDKTISDAYKRTILKGNEILFCVRGTTGVVSFASEELCGCNVTRGITPLSFDNHTNKYYIFYLIKSDSLQSLISEQTRGIALKQINMKDVRLLPVPLPPLSLQQSFAEKIESIEYQKSLIQQSIKEVQTLFDSRMDYYFN